MAHIGRTKNIEVPPRPLRSQNSRSSQNNPFNFIEDIIQLIESVAATLASGINNPEPMAALVSSLRVYGPQLETISKDTLDRAFVVFRNASQDERLNIKTRLNLLELIELRAKCWDDNGNNSYYKTKQATNATELDEPFQQMMIDAAQTGFLSTSPTLGVGTAGTAAAMAATVGTPQQQQLMLSPGELIRNSGKFAKPTKIPGKTYCKDEIVIRNADSGKVMGIKGRRVHLIEELSETVISFQKVNPGAKERLVQITGPTEEKINFGKQLIEDTIRRNASPVRPEATTTGGGGGGSCSSLASSNSDELITRATAVAPPASGGGSNLANRLNFSNTTQSFMSAANAAAQQIAAQQAFSMSHVVTPMPMQPVVNNKNARGQQQQPPMVMHSFSTNDASLGEYKYTVNVGQHVLKITGDCCELVRTAKLVLDDYFSSTEFSAFIDAGIAYDGSTLMSPLSAPSTPMSAGVPPHFAAGTPLQAAPLLADSGIGLNYMAAQVNNAQSEADDEVFVKEPKTTGNKQNNGLSRSRRSHFSRNDSSPEDEKTDKKSNETTQPITTIKYTPEFLLNFAKMPVAWNFPKDWETIKIKYPQITWNKDLNDTSGRFDPDKYVALQKSCSKRNIEANEENEE